MDACPVSVIIPTYNRAEFLNRALLSITRQTLRCAEIIVVDDGSTDNTPAILEAFSRTEKVPLTVLKQNNKGVASARNRGIVRAAHEYIVFLDSDDHWHKRKIEMQFKALKENPDYLISHTREKWLRRGIHLNQKRKHTPQHGNIFQHSLQLCAVGMSTVMVRKELFSLVGIFDETLRCCEDYDLWLRVSCRFSFNLIDSPLTVKEGGRADQVSYIYRTGMDRMRIYSIKKMLDSGILTKEQTILALDEFNRKCSVFGNGCIKHGKVETGEYYLNLVKDYLNNDKIVRT
ncbi:MAG: glycosyl transferase family A [Desulfobulbaceae bacterium S3730MH12]|nr:MAG: glycosyl transferase family A [Desulfobulbaceae bacterium S5133MH15]OEU54699.1 MAG: glycosyl transferase family A [Desulfobulbaceae bacterium S3730MH12]OEU81388.1 MAG: glycosyl transferase family A [Desulfobulbaceae bacterium C00003063]